MYAASVGYPETIDLLHRYGHELDARDVCGRSALHYCCRGGNIQNLTMLVSKIEDRALYESRSNGGITPLMSAIQSANVYMVGKCLNQGFNPFALDCTGKNCLDYAAPFKDINGENMRRLILTAQEQWQAQLTAEQFANVAIQPAIPEHFTPFYVDV